MNDVARHEEANPAIELPVPTKPRWQPLRIGLIELYHYDVQEFWFRDGHLLLRGNNGTGKSKVLSLTLPFLLDANLSASRVEPDGDRTKRMEWNLLMGKQYERRLGYTWIEFGRCDSTGTTHTLTLGCGLRAVAGRTSVDPWFFITPQRIGRDLWLTTPDNTVLTRERLVATLSGHGEVYPTAEAYRRAVDQKLFELGPERYNALVNTLIQLRQPQLSKQPNEQRLSDALTESLSPLDQTALASVAEAMTELEDIHRRLDELEAMLKAVNAFGQRYERYAQVEVRRRARTVRQAQTEHDAASREVNEAAEESTTADEQLKACRAAESALAEDLARVRARLDALRVDPRMIDAGRIQEATNRAGEAQRHLDQAQKHLHKLDADLKREVEAVQSRERLSEQSGTKLTRAYSALQETSSRCGVTVLPSPTLGQIEWPDGASTVTSDALRTFAQEVQASETRRREQIVVVRKRLQELHGVQQALELSQQAQRISEEALDAAEAASRVANSQLNEARVDLHTRWNHHATILRVLPLPNLDELLESLERWTSSMDGPNPVKAVLEHAWIAHEASAASELERISAGYQQLSARQTELRSEQLRLEQGEIRPPPAPHTRAIEDRQRRAGAPFWKLIDFAGDIPADAQARIEAGLEAAGILDAWVAPDGSLFDPLTQDAILIPSIPRSDSLDQWLIPTIPQDEPGAAISESKVTALLRSIACSESDASEAPAWVSLRGEYRLGTVRGAWDKATAQYIGHTARENTRLARLGQIARELEEIGKAIAAYDEEQTRTLATRETARTEYRQAPSDDSLTQAHAQLAAREQTRTEALTRLGEVQSKVLQNRNAVERAQDALELDARDLALPASADELVAVEGGLSELRLQMQDLLGAVGSHQSALVELATQRQREQQTRSDWEAAETERHERILTEQSTQETLRTLREAIGKEVDELLTAIRETDAKRRKIEATEPGARRETEAAVAAASAAKQKHTDLLHRLDERVAARRRAMDELQSFATETGFLTIATPEIALPEGTQQWGVENALNIARRAEQALSEVRADDADWQRIQREISTDLTELQTSMSAQGHSATAETSQGCFIVRIVYQQRPMRPDALAHSLGIELKEQKLILSAREREILEEHLEKEIAANLQRMINETDALVNSMNMELEARPTSTGVRFRLEWTPVADEDENGVVGLAAARRRLLKTSADAWSDEDRRELGAFLQSQIEAERQREDHGTVLESLSRALDYRHWHRFTVKRRHYGNWVPLSGPASSGERALGLTVPLFAAASSHYESAAPNAPRLVLLDEAFAGIDDEARAHCMGLIANFDLDFVMTSEREWGCYPSLPGLAICQIVRREGMDAAHVTRWTWDGREKTQQPDPTRRGRA